MTPTDRLERTYRRLLRWLPDRYRAEREEEMIAVLLAVADPHQHRPHPADTLNLTGAILHVWWRQLHHWARPRSATLTAAAVLITALAVAVLPARPAPHADTSRPAGLPQRFAPHSATTGSVSDAPPGRAIALYHQGNEPGHDIVLSADRDAYRQVDLATAHRTGDPSDTPAPALLSPDGSHVAVGYHRAKRPDVSIQNLATGDETTHTVATHPTGTWGSGAIPMAWSATGDQIALVVTPEADESGDARLIGDLIVLHLPTSRTTTVMTHADIAAVAFAPGGTELAIQQRSSTTLTIAGLDGTTRRTLTLPPGTGLTGPAAWSPDGHLLAVAQANAGCPDQHGLITTSDWCTTQHTRFLDATTTHPAVPAPITTSGRHRLVGWSAPDHVILLQDHATGDPTIADLRLGGATHQLSVLPTAHGNHPVGALQLATNLLTDLHTRPPTTPDRGRWPITWRLATAAAMTALAWLAITTATRAGRRRRTTTPHQTR